MDYIKFKGKYTIYWCELCKGASIECKSCNASSCNGFGCSICNNDLKEFSLICEIFAKQDCIIMQKTQAQIDRDKRINDILNNIFNDIQ